MSRGARSSYYVIMTLSLCMIVKDESAVLSRCLACAARFADEIIVVDTGSADDSKDIASRLGARVYDFEWRDDFSAARNYSFSLASSDYIMWLDADDIVEESDACLIRALVEGGGFDVAMLKYVSGNLCYCRERILRRSMNFVWQGAVHEVISPRGKVVYSDAKIVHKKEKSGDSLRNLIIYQRQIARGISLDERQKFYYGRELFYNSMYRQAAAVLEEFLRGGGWVVNKAEACRTLYFCYKRTGENNRARASLTRAFLYLAPRAQDCCILASEFLDDGRLDCAEYWYRRALDAPERVEEGGFVDGDYSAFIPYIGLAVVCDKRGDYAAAHDWNERAGAIKPDDASYIHNKQYLFQLLKKKN